MTLPSFSARLRVAALTASLALAVIPVGLSSASAQPTQPVFPEATDAGGAAVVVAVQDPKGINPYHDVYSRPHMTGHPCTRVEGFEDCSVPALDLSLDGFDTYAEAFRADQAVWDAVEPGQWYWIPGTNIIGAACDDETGLDPCLRAGGSVASSVLSEAPDALLLIGDSYDAPAEAFADAPVVPDLQVSTSKLGRTLPLSTADASAYGLDPTAADPGTVLFLAAPDPFRNESPVLRANGLTAGSDVQLVTGAFPGRAQPLAPAAADFASWYCRPTAEANQLDGTTTRCGTDHAAGTAAGAAGAVLQALRMQDGWTARSTAEDVSTLVSREAFIDGLRAAASYQPEAKFDVSRDEAVALPPGQEHLAYGYGWLDSTVVTDIIGCIADTATCPERSAEATDYNDRRREVREDQDDVYDDGRTNPVPSDDAGSGRDAGEDLATAVAVDLDTPYEATLVPAPRGPLDLPSFGGDVDWFTFHASAGQTVTVDIDFPGGLGPVTCNEILDITGVSLARTCGATLSVTVPTTGTYVFEIGYPVTAAQPFGFTIS